MSPVRQYCAGSILWTLRKFGGYCSGINACIFPGAAPRCICMPCAYAKCTDAAQTCASQTCASQTCALRIGSYARTLCACADAGTCYGACA